MWIGARGFAIAETVGWLEARICTLVRLEVCLTFWICRKLIIRSGLCRLGIVVLREMQKQKHRESIHLEMIPMREPKKKVARKHWMDHMVQNPTPIHTHTNG